MKIYIVLLLLILTTQLFSEEKPTVLSIENTYILDGTIDDKYPITMYLTINLDVKNNTKKISGKYYYNNIGEFIYLGESVLENTQDITLKEYTTFYDANEQANLENGFSGWKQYPTFYVANENTESTGEFKGVIDKNMGFKGTWTSEKSTFKYELKPRDNVVEIIESTFSKKERENIDFYTDLMVLKLVNSKKSPSIEKLNKELASNFDSLYSRWKEGISPETTEHRLYYYKNSYLEYIDNNILSVGYINMHHRGTLRINFNYNSATYSLSSGKRLTVDDLISDVDDDELVDLMHRKLVDYADSMEAKYYNFYNRGFSDIRLRDSYSVNNTGITFLYNYLAISFENDIEPITIHFTYDELKPFVKKSSPLWYLFE